MGRREDKRSVGRQYYANNSKKISDWYRNYHKTHRKEVRTHKDVYAAVQAGLLIRKPCDVCGATENVQAHHDDYDKPLDVRWLCMSHHKLLHARLRREA